MAEARQSDLFASEFAVSYYEISYCAKLHGSGNVFCPFCNKPTRLSFIYPERETDGRQ